MSFKTSMLRAVNKTVFTCKKYSPEILTGAAIVGTVATVYLSVKAAKKLEQHIDAMEKDPKTGAVTDKKELVKVCVKDLWLPTFTGMASMGCMIGSHIINRNRILGLTSALGLANANHQRLKYNVAAELGREKAEELDQPVQITKPSDGEHPAEGIIIEDARYNCVLFANCGWHTDDPEYNKNIIKTIEQAIEKHWQISDYLSYNQLASYLKLDKGMTLEGHGIGWRKGMWSGSFNIRPICCTNPSTGMPYDEYVLSWPQPTYIYEDADFIPFENKDMNNELLF